MTDKEALDRLSGINMSIEQKYAFIDVIKNIAKNNESSNTDEDTIIIDISNSTSMNVYDKNYPFDETNDELVAIANVELYNKLRNDLLNNKKVIINIFNKENNNIRKYIVLAYRISDNNIVLFTMNDIDIFIIEIDNFN